MDRNRPIANMPCDSQKWHMKKIPPSNAELRFQWMPFKTWAACTFIGAILTLVRNLLYDIPIVPVRPGLTPFIVMFLFGAAYATVGFTYLMVRRLTVDAEGRSRF